MAGSENAIASISVEELTKIVAEAVRSALQTTPATQANNEPIYITRAAAAKMLNVSLPIIDGMRKDGLLPFYRVSKRKLLFKPEDVRKAFDKVKGAA